MKIIKIGATWCNGCIVMRPRWKKIESENTWLQTEYYDFDSDSEKITKYGIEISKLPTFIFLDKNDIEIERLSGEIEEDQLKDLINKHKDK